MFSSLTLRRYWFLLGEQHKGLLKVFSASLIVSFFDALSVALVGPFVMSFVSPEALISLSIYKESVAYLRLDHLDPMVVMAFALLLAVTLKLVLSSAVLAVIFNFCAQVDYRLRERLLDQYSAMPLINLGSTRSSTLVQAVHTFTGSFAFGLVGQQLRLLTEFLITLAILSYLFYLHPLGFVLLLSGIFSVVGLYYMAVRKRIHDYGKESALMGEQLISSVRDFVSGMREIRTYGVEERLLEHAKNAAMRFTTVNSRYQWLSILSKYVIEFCLIGGVSSIAILMHYTEMPRDKIMPVMAVFGAAVIRLAPAAYYLINGLVLIRFNAYVVDSLYEILDKEEEVVHFQFSPNKKRELIGSVDVIELQDVAFNYDDRSPPVFDGVTLSIRSGESIGFVGPSGGGKTTLAEMILGFLEPTKGGVNVNGVPRKEFDLDDLKGHFAYIPQQIYILDASISDNISLMDDGSKDDVRQKVLDAVIKSQLDMFIKSLPYGLDTHCGENGVKLSGGQKQRIALARAFYHNRSILIMDEATSALDYETEQEVIEEIKVLKGRVTLIVIAHRLETVADCDRWFRVESGCVREIEHSELKVYQNNGE